jgi:regulatory protein
VSLNDGSVSKKTRPPPKLDLGWLRQEARRYLERQRPSEARLHQVLMRRVDRALQFHGGDRAAGEALADAVVAELRQSGVLDDARWARAWVGDLHRRGQSRPVIQQKLRLLGGDQQVIATAMDEVLGPRAGSDLEAAQSYVRRKRIGPHRSDPVLRRDKRQRDLAAVARAGFSLGVALKVIDDA